jgi:hypothetical protein
MRTVTTLAITALFLTAVSPAVAADIEIVKASDPQGVIDALTQIGYQGAKLEPWESGRPSISVKISGSPTYIDFFDCAKDFTGCQTLVFYYAMDLEKGTTLEEANKWNAEQVTGRVYLDDNNDPTLDYAVSTFDGLPIAVFEDTVKLWDTKVGHVKDFFHF